MPTAATGSAGKRPLRLLRSDRLRKRFEFRRVRDTGRRVHTESFVLLVAPAPSSRIGLTVSRKVGGAVRRNRIKRLIRELFRTRRELFPDGCEVVAIARDRCAIDGLAQLTREMEAAQPALSRTARQLAHGRRGGA